MNQKKGFVCIIFILIDNFFTFSLIFLVYFIKKKIILFQKKITFNIFNIFYFNF
jgi:hypothetical protein